MRYGSSVRGHQTVIPALAQQVKMEKIVIYMNAVPETAHSLSCVGYG
jgi:hypothetical protein